VCTVKGAYFFLRILENILVDERGSGVAGTRPGLPCHIVAGILERIRKEVEREVFTFFSLVKAKWRYT